MKTVVLSGKYADTKRFVKAMNLPAQITHVMHAEKLSGLRGDVEVHILPSYAQRRDRAAIEACLARAEYRGTVKRRHWSESESGTWYTDYGDIARGEPAATAPEREPIIEQLAEMAQDRTLEKQKVAEVLAAAEIEHDDFFADLEEDGS